jgi:protein-tyrosine kinase
MERIRQALQRVRSTPSPAGPQGFGAGRQSGGGSLDIGAGEANLEHSTPLDAAHLEKNRVITHNHGDERARNYHMLRTQLGREMDAKGWQFLAVTSPTSKCGKTATAVNLALSMARQPDRATILVDLDLSKPKVANCLGLKCDRGLASTLTGKTTLFEAITPVVIDKYRLLVLPAETALPNSPEWLASQQMSSILQELKASYRSAIVIFNLPPILRSDEAIAGLPHMDCVVLVTAIGVSALSQVRACDKFLASTAVVRIVVNQAP